MVVAGGLVSANYRGLSISIEGREGGAVWTISLKIIF